VSEFGNISLSNEAFMDASGEGGGDVQIRGARLEMTQGTAVRADTVGAGGGGEVLVRTTEEVVLSEDSLLIADVTQTGTGTGGNLTIDTGRLLLRSGAQVGAGTNGEGDGGSIQIIASEVVEAIGISADGPFPSGLFTRSEGGGGGNAGDLSIDTRRLLVSDGAVVSASTFGAGKGGSVQIQASEGIELIGTTPDGWASSGLFAQSQGSGEAGDLTIITGRLLVRDGAQVLTSGRAEGDGGNLQIIASESVEAIGESADGRIGSGLFAGSRGSGNAGNLSLDTGRLLVSNGAQVSTDTRAEGDGGNLQITASEVVELIGTSADGLFPSALFTQSRGSGNAGDLSIDTGRLLVRDGAAVSTSTFGEGKGGNLLIQASESVEAIGSSNLVTRTFGSGNAGNLSIDTGRLLVRDGAQVSTDTRAEGDGGSLQITASNSVEAIGPSADGLFPSGLFTQSRGSGNAGDLSLDTGRLLVRDRAAVSTSTFGEGKGGNLLIQASESVEAIGSSDLVTATLGSGNAGNLSIDTGRLLVRDGAQVSTDTRAEGDGGNLQITASDSVEVIGESADDRISSALIAASRGSGNAGDLTIITGRLLVRDGAGLFVSSRDTNAGDITITTPLLALIDRGRLSAASAGQEGGNIILSDLTLLILRQGSVISAQAENAANGGNITINADNGFVVSVPEENSDIIANAEQGNGGNIAITAQGVFGLTVNPSPTLLPVSEINASSEAGIDGTVVINNPNVNLQATTSLPETFREPSLAQGCEASASESRFTNVGRGGVPSNPTDPLTPYSLWQDFLDLDRLDVGSSNRQNPLSPASPQSPASRQPLREAQGWVVDADGTVRLVAYEPTATPPRLEDLRCLSGREEPTS
jgi:large exoprotein involved in heme utilization and adhesion